MASTYKLERKDVREVKIKKDIIIRDTKPRYTKK